jgi:predicted MFS family arabinose efflux permease
MNATLETSTDHSGVGAALPRTGLDLHESRSTSWRALVGAIYGGVVALLVVNALPALVSAIATGLKWDDRALGLFASADVAGITVGSVVGVAVVRRLSLRAVAAGGILLLLGADVACAVGTAQAFVVSCRFIGGLASGLILTACYAVYSASHAQRNFALFSIGQMTSSFVAVTAIPMLSARFGWHSSLYFIACLTALAFPLSLSLPGHTYAKQPPAALARPQEHSSYAVWGAVGGLLVYIVGEGAVWTFMERMGLASGIPAHSVNMAVSACALAGLFGALLMLFPSRRLGVLLPLTITTIMSVVGISLMQTSSAVLFVAALCAYTFAWLAFSTVQFAVIAEADTAGTATISMSAAWYAGFAIGPYLAGALVERFGFVPVQVLGVAGALLAFFSILPLRTVNRRADRPPETDALITMNEAASTKAAE